MEDRATYRVLPERTGGYSIVMFMDGLPSVIDHAKSYEAATKKRDRWAKREARAAAIRAKRGARGRVPQLGE